MSKKLFLTVTALAFLSVQGYTHQVIAQQPAMYEINVRKDINVSRAENLYKEGNVDKALEVYNEILDTNPNSIPARVGLASVYSDLYKIKAAQREFQKVLSIDPNNSDALNGLGQTYYRATTSSNMDIRDNIGSFYRRASTYFQKAIQANPNNDKALANLGNIYQHQGRLEEADQMYRKSLEANPMNSDANFRMGTIFYEKGDVDTAIGYYQKSLEVNSKNSSAHFHLGEALLAKGRYSDAIEALQTSLYLHPQSAPVHEKLGEAYKHQGNETAAIEEFKKAIAIKPEDTLPYLLLSSVYEDRGDDELAIAELKSALKNNPDFSEAKLKIADMSTKLNKVDQAIEYYKKTLIDDPGNPLAEGGLSKAYFKKVQTDVASGIIASPARLLEAEKYVQKAIRNNPEDLELYYAKFKLEKMANKPEPTKQQLQLMAQKIPTNVPEAMDKGYALFMLLDIPQANKIFKGVVNQVTEPEKKMLVAQTLVEYKNYNIAQEIFQNALMEDNENVEAQRGLELIKQKREQASENYRLGWDLYKKGQRKSAVDQFKKAQNIDPAFAKPYYWAAETLKKDKQFASARDNYEAFLMIANNVQPQPEDKEFQKWIKHAEKMVHKLRNKENKS